MGFKALQEKDPGDVREAHRQRLQAHPRRRQLALAADRGARPGKRSAPDLGNQGASRRGESHGRSQRRPRPLQAFPKGTRRLREGRPTGMVRPFLVHLVRSREPHGEGREVHRDGRFDSEENQIPRGFQEKGR